MSSLWRGKDHLIYVRGRGFLIPLSEDYKRYRFEDIQAITISRKSRAGAALLHGLAFLFFVIPLILLLAFTTDQNLGMGRAILTSVVALGSLWFGAMLLRHFILGPTCVCDLQTSLSRDRLVPLTRLHTTRQCVDAIAGDIRAAQEPLKAAPAAEVVALEAGAGKAGELFSIPIPVLPTFIGVGLLGLGALAALHLESIAMTVFLLVLLLAVSFSLTFSQIASVRRLTPDSIRTTLWITMGLLFLFTGSATVYLLISAARNPEYSLDFMGPLEILTGVASVGGVGFYLLFLALSLGFFVSGVVGVLTVLRWRALIREMEGENATPKPENGE
ncbi:MAG: hypothetical protein AAF733_08770 [Verrucomicrobiota bacterium]